MTTIENLASPGGSTGIGARIYTEKSSRWMASASIELHESMG